MPLIASAFVPASASRPRLRGRPGRVLGRTRLVCRARWARRLGLLSFGFFLLKGFAWLGLAAVAAAGVL